MTDGELVSIVVESLPEAGALERLWVSLESRSEASFFISWGWIGTWLASLPAEFAPRLLRVMSGADLIGLAILVNRGYLRHRLIPVVETHLNATGSHHYDALTIEYNDILWDRLLPQEVKVAALQKIVSEWGIEELHAAGVAPDSCWNAPSLPGVNQSVFIRQCNGVDLNEVRTGGGYLQFISANTRSKIRKSMKELSQGGPLTIECAQNLHDAESMYVALVALHQQAWVARGKPGAFSNRYVYEFHLQLIRNRLASGEIQLLKISSGERLLGVLYNFVYRGRVYNYQSGIDYGHGHERSKPGFVMHSMAIEHCEKEGFTYYDLMAGDSQYKRSLGTRSNNLHWIVLQQRKCKFGFEDSLRRAKRLAFGSPVIA